MKQSNVMDKDNETQFIPGHLRQIHENFSKTIILSKVKKRKLGIRLFGTTTNCGVCLKSHMLRGESNWSAFA